MQRERDEIRTGIKAHHRVSQGGQHLQLSPHRTPHLSHLAHFCLRVLRICLHLHAHLRDCLLWRGATSTWHSRELHTGMRVDMAALACVLSCSVRFCGGEALERLSRRGCALGMALLQAFDLLLLIPALLVLPAVVGSRIDPHLLHHLLVEPAVLLPQLLHLRLQPESMLLQCTAAATVSPSVL